MAQTTAHAPLLKKETNKNRRQQQATSQSAVDDRFSPNKRPEQGFLHQRRFILAHGPSCLVLRATKKRRYAFGTTFLRVRRRHSGRTST
jgi:hypothetical protein